MATALVTPAILLCTPAAAQTATPPAAAAPATPPAAKPVVALGNIRAFGDVTASGNIRAFEGDVDPYGNIRAFAGAVEANGNIRSFNGAINPYIGNIRSFSGAVNPLVGNIRSFWGQLTPTNGELNPLIGNIRSFAGTFDATTVDLLNSWNTAAASGNYDATATKLKTLVTQSQTAWGDAVKARTGKNFSDGFAKPLFAKYGIDPAKAPSLAVLDAVTRQLFLMDWYDGLMGYSGHGPGRSLDEARSTGRRRSPRRSAKARRASSACSTSPSPATVPRISSNTTASRPSPTATARRWPA